MRFIPTRIHGVLDYLMGALLIASPWLFNFNLGGLETWIPVILGASVILYSLFTDYELGAIKKLPMSTHLILDLAGGAVLAFSPWLFGFSDIVFWPHLVLGFAEMGAALFTERIPYTDTAGKSQENASQKGSFTERKTHGDSPASRDTADRQASRDSADTPASRGTADTPASRGPMARTDTSRKNESERSERKGSDREQL